jgi:alpha-tubulin suppressor-like RCC1 family protein
VYTWGNNESGQLGLKNISYSTKFKKVENLIEITDVKAGIHSAAIDNSGRCYVWGEWFAKRYLYPTKVHKIFDSFRKELAPIKSIGIGHDFTVMINHKGKVYSWNQDQDLDIQPPQIQKLNTSERNVKATELAWGSDFVVALGHTHSKNIHKESDKENQFNMNAIANSRSKSKSYERKKNITVNDTGIGLVSKSYASFVNQPIVYENNIDDSYGYKQRSVTPSIEDMKYIHSRKSSKLKFTNKILVNEGSSI